jgi:hypothetical protein
MHQLTLLCNGARHDLQFPSKWEEVKPEQLIPIALAQVMMGALKDEEKGTPHDLSLRAVHIRKELLRELANVPALFMDAMEIDDLRFEVDTTDYHTGFKPILKKEWRLLPQLDWAFAPPEYDISLLPTIELDGTTWQGPDDRFDTMTLNQWLWAAQTNRAYKSMEGHERIEQFHLHLACLYTPEGTPWSNMHLEQHAKQLRALPEDVKLAALLNYEAIQATLPRLYPRVYDPSGEAGQSPMGVFGMAYDVAKSGVFGTKQEVEKVRAHEALGYMEHTLYQDELAERKAKKNAKKK